MRSAREALGDGVGEHRGGGGTDTRQGTNNEAGTRTREKFPPGDDGILQAREEQAEREGCEAPVDGDSERHEHLRKPEQADRDHRGIQPVEKCIWPKVKQAGPAIGSRPTMPSPKPSAKATKPLMAFRPPSTLTSDSAKHIIAVISVGPNPSAAREIGTDSGDQPYYAKQAADKGGE